MLAKGISREHQEIWWQKFISTNVPVLFPEYACALGKLNVAVGNTKFPDFALITHDHYLDILEIKTPKTELVKVDRSRHNFHWSAALSNAITQTEIYLDAVMKHSDALRAYLLDTHGMHVTVRRPQGLILAGDARSLRSTKERDDFRLLSQSNKNIAVNTYDQLLNRLKQLEAFISRKPSDRAKP